MMKNLEKMNDVKLGAYKARLIDELRRVDAVSRRRWEAQLEGFRKKCKAIGIDIDALPWSTVQARIAAFAKRKTPDSEGLRNQA